MADLVGHCAGMSLSRRPGGKPATQHAVPPPFRWPSPSGAGPVVGRTAAGASLGEQVPVIVRGHTPGAPGDGRNTCSHGNRITHYVRMGEEPARPREIK